MLYFRDHSEYLRPYWNGGVIVNESIMPLHMKDETGEVEIQLMNDIAHVISVKTATLDREFVEGHDYFVRDGKLVIPESSDIRIMPWEEYNVEDDPTPFHLKCEGGGFLRFGEGNTFHLLQYAVTYESASNLFDGKYRPTEAPELAKSRALLKSNERDFKLAFYGDSITYGCNASGLGIGAPPYMPVYPLLAAEYLRSCGYNIDYYNPSIGGMDSNWGRNRAAFYFDNFKPDLTMIAFGMNDGTGKMPVERYIENIKSIISTIRQKNPETEFVLTATTLPNPLAVSFAGYQPDYEQPLAELAKTEGCAFLDMTEMHRIMIERKGFYHMTGNNVNHPTDFLARLYAQGLLALISES